MACFGGPSYSEINVESKPFLQVTLNLPKNRKMIELVDLNGEMYTNVAGGSQSNNNKGGKNLSCLHSLLKDQTKFPPEPLKNLHR